jgi:hypothetical protein
MGNPANKGDFAMPGSAVSGKGHQHVTANPATTTGYRT